MEKNDIIKRVDENLFNNRRLVLSSLLDRKINQSDGILQLLDLEIYNNTAESFTRRLEKAISSSKVDDTIELSKYQIECMELLEKGDLFISAPTSFGKTFIAFEYIKRNESILDNILFIVPTIALMNELFKKLLDHFGEKYNIILNDFEIEEEDINLKNIFVLVPERTMGKKFSVLLSKIDLDFCVYDEIYKLSRKRSIEDDRLIIMNFVYAKMIKKAKKILLLGPFIKQLNLVKSERNIQQYITDYTPVLNEINTSIDYQWWKDENNEKRLIYYESPANIQKAILNLDKNIVKLTTTSEDIEDVIDWIKENVYEKWYYIPLLRKGIGVHHGKTPLYLRSYIENSFRVETHIHSIICTSTLMEGINTPTNKLVIVDSPKNQFELNNLIGRVARLNVKNPIKGNIISLSNINESNLYNTSNWEEITLLYDDEEKVEDPDEYLYLDKIDESELYWKYKEFMNELKNDYSITKENIRELGVRYNIIYRYIKSGVHDKLISYLNEDDYNNAKVIEIMRSCIPIGRSSSYFRRDNYSSLKEKYLDEKKIEFLNITIPMKILMEQNSMKNVIMYFIKNETPDEVDVNRYVDAVLELASYIRFKFSQSILLLDLFSHHFTSKQSKKVKRFVDMVMNFVGKDERLRKVLLDLGIPIEDCNTIEVLLLQNGLKKSYKSSNVLKTLKVLQKNNRINELSPFSKKVIFSVK